MRSFGSPQLCNNISHQDNSLRSQTYYYIPILCILSIGVCSWLNSEVWLHLSDKHEHLLHILKKQSLTFQGLPLSENCCLQVTNSFNNPADGYTGWEQKCMFEFKMPCLLFYMHNVPAVAWLGINHECKHIPQTRMDHSQHVQRATILLNM